MLLKSVRYRWKGSKMKETEVGGGRGTVSVARLLHLETLINNINSTIHNKGCGKENIGKENLQAYI